MPRAILENPEVLVGYITGAWGEGSEDKGTDLWKHSSWFKLNFPTEGAR